MFALLIVQRGNGGVNHQPGRPSINTQPTALDAYLQRLAMFLSKVEALHQLADGHFGHDP